MSKNKENNEKTPKKSLTISQRRVRHGVFTTTSIIIVIAVVIAINMFVSTKIWDYDFSDNKIYTLSEESKNIAGDLTKEEKITIYFLDKESNTNTVYRTILSQYEKASKYIDVEYKDLELYPNFANQYLGDGETAATDDMIVVCGDRYRYISSSEYLSTSYDSSYNATTSINMEPKVTSAIDYVISEETPVIYTLTGQGEADLGSNIQSALETDNYDLQSLDIVTTGGIPEDCDLLIINAPTNDLDSSIIDMISEYMENDGKLYVVLDPNQMYDNLNGLLATYGVQVEEGIVIENGSGYYMGNYPTYLLPTISSNDITTPIAESGLHILAPVSKGMTSISDVTDYTVTDLLVTSADSYSKVDTTSEDYSQTEEDVQGPLAIAQVVDNSEGEGVLVVCGSSSLGVDEIDSYVSGANANFAVNAMNYLTNEDSKISVKPTSVTNNSAVFTAFATKMVMALGVVGIPLFILMIGFVVWIVRRNS